MKHKIVYDCIDKYQNANIRHESIRDDSSQSTRRWKTVPNTIISKTLLLEKRELGDSLERLD